MIIQHNMTALYANRMGGVVEDRISKSTEKLSSGYRINRAGDDAAGLAISEKMRGQIRGLNQASSNAQDGISLIQTAEGALTETHSLLQRMRELAVQASSDTNTEDDRTQIQNEINQLTSEVNRIANTTEFNTKKLLDGCRTGAVEVKNGTIKLEGNFDNSTISAKIVTGSNAEYNSFTDVIRIEIKQNFTSTMTGYSEVSDMINVNDLFGSYKTTAANDGLGISIGTNSTISTGNLEFSINTGGTVEAGFAKTETGDKGYTIKIENAQRLKAGDVITITAQKREKSQPAKTGEDALRLQIGANAGQELSLGINSMKASDLNIVQTKDGKDGQALDVTSQVNASLAINAYDLALQKVSTERAKMGAIQNRLEHTISNLDTSAENLQTAESRIRDVDMASEMVNFAKDGIIQQAAQSMLAQANQSNQGVLKLLQ